MTKRRPPQRRRRTKEVPRWRKTATSPQLRSSGPWWWRRDPEPFPQLYTGSVSGRQAKAMAAQAQQLQTAMQVQLLATMQQGAAGAAGKVAAAPVKLQRRSWRFRHHVQPFVWLVVLLAVGTALHLGPSPLLWGCVAAVAVPAAVWLVSCQRRKDKTYVFKAWTQRFMLCEGVASGLWLPFLACLGPRVCFAWVLLSWLPFIGLWVRRYRWRPADKPAAPDEPLADDRSTFAALAEAQKWSARLGAREQLAGGGRRYEVQCDGIKTVMKKILAQPDFVSGAWHSTVTEVYAERDPKGVTSRGYLTILPGNSLQAGRFWNGRGMDPVTGLARVGRFADGSNSHFKLYTPRFGCRHDLISGTTGSGKTKLLDLLVFTALQTGWFVPVILDPQEGQSLPFWRDRCIYASGPVQVERTLRGLYAAFQDRSGQLAVTPYSEDGVDYPGMPFFDLELITQALGYPLLMPWIFLDEAHMVLKGDTKYQRQSTAAVVDMARLIRKAGGRMTLATQLPSLTDLGGSQALRDMLRGGNVWSGRTANKVGQGMLGLVKDPSEIPRYFGDGSETAGLSYTDGPENRPDAPMRTDIPATEHYRNPPSVPRLDDRFLEVMDKAMKEAVSPTSTVAPVPRPRPAPGALGYRLGALNPPAELEKSVPDVLEDPVDDAPEGKRCVDAVLQVLADSPDPLNRGEIAKWVGDLSRAWERDKPWGLKMIGNVLRDLLAAGTIEQPDGKGGPYRLVPKDSPA